MGALTFGCTDMVSTDVHEGVLIWVSTDVHEGSTDFHLRVRYGVHEGDLYG